MGTLAVDQPRTAKLYGDLGVRFNTLRQLYRCVRDQVTNHKSPEQCL